MDRLFYGDNLEVVRQRIPNELLGGKRPAMPPTVLPYIQAQRRQISEHQDALFDA